MVAGDEGVNLFSAHSFKGGLRASWRGFPDREVGPEMLVTIRACHHKILEMFYVPRGFKHSFWHDDWSRNGDEAVSVNEQFQP
jgi:hypothetical protein